MTHLQHIFLQKILSIFPVFSQMVRWSQLPRCYCSLPTVQFLRMVPFCCRRQPNYLSMLRNSTRIQKTSYLKPLLLTILTSSFSCYACPKDARSKPGNLPTTPCEIQSSTSTFCTKITEVISRKKCNRPFGFMSLLFWVSPASTFSVTSGFGIAVVVEISRIGSSVMAGERMRS